MQGVQYLLLELGALSQEDPVPVIDHLVHHSVPVICHLSIQNLIGKMVLGVLYQQLSPPVCVQTHQGQHCRSAGKCICHNVVLPLDILDVKVINLDLADPLLLPLLQLFLL